MRVSDFEYSMSNEKVDYIRTLDRKYKIEKEFCLLFKLLFIGCIAVTIGLWMMLNNSLFSLTYIYACTSFTLAVLLSWVITNSKCKKTYAKDLSALESAIQNEIGCHGWQFTTKRDAFVALKSSASVSKYDEIKYFKEDPSRLDRAVNIMRSKEKYAKAIRSFLKNNLYTDCMLYNNVEAKLNNNLYLTNSFFIVVNYVSPAGRKSETRIIALDIDYVEKLSYDRSRIMSKSEYNKSLKEANKVLLEQKQKMYYGKINQIIDMANEARDALVVSSDRDELDKLAFTIFDKPAKTIKKIKSTDSEEWALLDMVISNIKTDVTKIIEKNKSITDYYNSDAFTKVKNTCDKLMLSQREFNDYIDEKIQSIASLFGTAVLRNETVNEDEYDYVHTYKKSITPFTAEVSAAVFASAENNPLDYVVKIFYPNKAMYPEQIQKLHTLIEELETLKEAKQIIESQKTEVQEYISSVPPYIKENDEDGFYARLGFATINEKSLVIEYKFVYTSNAGKAQRSFTVPMTEETIVNLIDKLESKLTFTAFSKEQRALMTSKLRQRIKKRDDFTCQICGNSTHREPNLLLEVDHIIPVAKGGYTEESNLQTLCWKCNRSKSDKIV